MQRHTIFTTTALRELQTVPAKERDDLLNNIDLLARDPRSSRLDLRPLYKHPGFHRLKVGRWRVFCRLDEYLEIHAVRQRKEDTYSRPFNPRTLPTPGALPATPPADWDEEDEKLATGGPPEGQIFPLRSEQLESWGLPRLYFPQFLRCTSDDDLLNLGGTVPEKWVMHVINMLYRPGLDQTRSEAQYVVHSRQELEGYLSGRLSDLLLRLDPEQVRASEWRLEGPALVRGGPGTGKTVVALYRVLAYAQHRPGSRVLFATYTTTLAHYAEQLLSRLLEERGLDAKVEVSWVDRLVRQNLKASSWKIVGDAEQLEAVKAVLAELRDPFLQGLGPRYLRDEFHDVIQAWDLDHEGYLGFPRHGRQLPLYPEEREKVWVAYDRWRRKLDQRRLLSWNRARAAARASAQPAYDAVIVDEAQDLPPVALRFLLKLAKDPKGFYLTADANQSLYQQGFSFKAVDQALDMRGRGLLLRRNYRSTRPIHAALAALAQHPSLESEDLPEPAHREGPKPLLVGVEQGAEARLLRELIYRLCRQLRVPLSGVGLLCPSEARAKEVVTALNQLDVPAAWSKGEDLELDQPVVKALTLHSAKGLEFPVVLVLDVNQGTLPRRAAVPAEEAGAYEARDRRLFYVACSRAMRALAVVYDPRRPSPFVHELPPELWERLDGPDGLGKTEQP